MEHSDFQIGREFWTATGRWRLTDIGTRTIAAIKLDKEDTFYYDGPPYSVVENNFDEYDMGGCFSSEPVRDEEISTETSADLRQRKRPTGSRINSGSLFVSFWKVGLPNLPEGLFRRRRLSSDEAKALIDQARQRDALVCVCDEDLLAPYCKRAAEKHEELRDVLSEHFGIHLTIDDFTHKYESDEGNSYHVAPLAVATVDNEGQLLVVTCYYMAEKRKTGRMPPFEIDPDSVEFSIFESANNVQGLVAHEVHSTGSVLL
jgi:hypothetical protein